LATQAKPPVEASLPIVVTPPKALPAPSAREHAARFGLDMLAPSTGRVPLIRLQGAYLDWCRARDLDPLPVREIGIALDDLFARSGLTVAEVNGVPHLLGARLKAMPRRALGRGLTVRLVGAVGREMQPALTVGKDVG
jgi:hypothetical protein